MYKYSHGGNVIFEKGKEDYIDLSANINPLGMPTTVTEAIVRAIPDCAVYPDNFSTKLRLKIAEYEGINPDWIICGNGASDIILRLPRAVMAKKVMVTAPTFSDYEKAALSGGAEIIRYMLTPENEFNLDGGFIDAVRNNKPDLVFVCNPNNPTGKLTEPGILKSLLDCCKQMGTLVAIDECFMDFTEYAGLYTTKPSLEKYPNLIIFKAFTKLFTLPGIRLGYAMCADISLINNLYRHGTDWAVSCLAQSAGIAALDNAEEFVKRTVSYVSYERATMEVALTQKGYKVFHSAANYIFFQNPFPYNLCEELDKKGIRIRSCQNYHGLDCSYYRTAVSTQKNNAKLLAEMGNIIYEK